MCWSLFLIKLQAFKLATLLKRDSNTGAFLCILQIYIYFEKHLQMAVSDYSFTSVIYLFPLSLYNYVKELWYFMVKKMFIEIRCNPMTYNLKGHVKIVEIYMVKFKVSVLNRLKLMGFFVNAKYIRKYNVILNKTVTKISLFWQNVFFHIWTLQANLT